MKKLIAAAAALLAAVSVLTVPAFASESRISSLDIRTDIAEDGSATVTEKLDMYAYQGTEMYIPMNQNMSGRKVSLLGVYESGKAYTNAGTWNSSWSRNKKAEQYGMSKANEICFGVGGYGRKKYTVKYRIGGFVTEYSDAYGVNWTFFSNMALPVGRAKVTVTSEKEELTSEKSRIWAFGFSGRCAFSDGTIVLSGENQKRMQLLARLGSSYSDAHKVSASFVSVQSAAMKGSSYEKAAEKAAETETQSAQSDDEDYKVHLLMDPFQAFLGSVALGLVIGIAIIALAFVTKLLIRLFPGIGGTPYLKKRAKVERKQLRNVEPYSSVPDDSLHVFLFVANSLGYISDAGDIASAYILYWIEHGNIGFSRKKRPVLSKDKAPEDPADRMLYTMLLSAAGKTGELWKEDFHSYASRHHDKFASWVSLLDEECAREAKDAGICAVTDDGNHGSSGSSGGGLC